MAEIEILGRRDVLSRDPQRVGRTDRLILYRVDGQPQQSYWVTVPLEQWSDKAETEAIAKAERERKAGTLRKFTIP